MYHQIKEDLREAIGEMDYGAQIKTEQQLAAEYGVSRGTVRQAINELVNEGLLYKVQGCGTFKGGAAISHYRFMVESYTKQLLMCGMEPGIGDVRLTSVVPEARVAKMLQVPEGKAVWRFFRIRLGNGKPISMCNAYIRKDVVPQLRQEDLEMSLISMFLDKLHIPLVRRESYCTACLADDETARLIHVKPGAPIFRTEHVAFVNDETPVFFDITDSVGDRFVMRIEQYSKFP